ncbi:MAG: aminotransferase class I/II-fold pyridoxal phosphate-dependent enzyme [Kiritimatiellae bacterium]|jgi:aspartate/methionine/tyrosine aminotransferase|nr:aminotransferase class I/II-fold pyridoxal phosphate-dependent enzyme [Kiritimatiellia bacterium]
MSQELNELAVELNTVLGSANSPVASLLSERGKRAYFPSRGILGQSAAARGADINATIGTAFENDGTPLTLECLAEKVGLDNKAFLYTPSYGLPALRKKWREMMVEKNPTLNNKDFSVPVVTHALTHGLSISSLLFIDQDDTVILPDLYWDNYDLLMHEGYGAKLTTFPMFQDGAFNAAGMEEMLMAEGQKKIVLLNFPNNPTGYSATIEDAANICKAVIRAADAGKKLVILVDDAYFGLVYKEGVHTESLFAELANCHDNVLAVKLDGPTKEDYVWGFRTGFITFGCKACKAEQYKALEAKSAGVVRGSISSTSSLAQHFLLHAYELPEYKVQKQNKFATLQERYNRIESIFSEHPEYAESFSPMPFNSGYFMCVKPQGVDAEVLRKLLLEKYSTGVIMLSGLLRIAFSSVPLQKLDTLFANLHNAVQEMKQG